MLLVRPLVRRLGERRAALFGLVCGMGGFLTFGLAPTGAIFLFGIALVALWGVANPSFQALMSRRIDPSEQGQLQGALGSIRAITGMLGPVVFTQVFAVAVRRGGESLLGAPFLLSAGLLLLTLLVALRVLPHRVATH
jgi:DHA1 family tetracycline resistance protein-like MFS transporter